MLNNYCTAHGYVEACTESAILSVQHAKRLHAGEQLRAVKRPTYTPTTSARSYRGRTDRPQTAIGRMRCVVSRLFSFDHATTGSVARAILKQSRFVRLDIDSPETHLAFSPDAVKSRDTKRRRSLPVGRFLRRKCAELLKNRLALTDAQIELAGHAFSTVPSFPAKLSIVTGEEALAVYNGGGIRSCMSWDHEEDEDERKVKSDIISHHILANPDKLRLIVGYSSGKLVLRAKLYRNDDRLSLHIVEHFLDRVYWKCAPLNCDNESELREWITSWLLLQGIHLAEKYNVTLNHVEGEPLPYLDRADQFDRDGDTIHLHSRGNYTAGAIDGTDESVNDERSTCCECGCRVDDDDLRCSDCGDCYCSDCHSQQFTYDDLNDCDIDNDDAVQVMTTGRHPHLVTTDRNSDDVCEIDGDYYLTSSDDVCEIDGDYYLTSSDDVCEIDGDYYLVSSDDVCEIDGDYYLVSSDDVCEIDGDYYLTSSDDVCEIDGDYYLTSSDDVCEIVDNYGNCVFALAFALECA